MQKDSWNIIYLHPVLNIETLQLMQPKTKNKLQSYLLCSHCDFFKVTKLQFQTFSTYYVVPFTMFASHVEKIKTTNL
jgi:hypothetical protein